MKANFSLEGKVALVTGAAYGIGFAIAEALGFRAVEIRAVSNIVGDDFAKWNIELATQNLAKTLLKYAE